MATVRTAYTADLDIATLTAARALLEEGDGAVFVFPVVPPLDLFGELVCDWRDGDVW
jgi:hypothetical protein